MKPITLNERQQALASENVSVVKYAIHKYITVNDNLCR